MVRRKQTSVDGIQTDNRGLLQQLQQSFVSSVHILYFVTVVTTGMRNEKAFQFSRLNAFVPTERRISTKNLMIRTNVRL
jgi:hypothetical protein